MNIVNIKDNSKHTLALKQRNIPQTPLVTSHFVAA